MKTLQKKNKGLYMKGILGNENTIKAYWKLEFEVRQVVIKNPNPTQTRVEF